MAEFRQSMAMLGEELDGATVSSSSNSVCLFWLDATVMCLIKSKLLPGQREYWMGQMAMLGGLDGTMGSLCAARCYCHTRLAWLLQWGALSAPPRKPHPPCTA